MDKKIILKLEIQIDDFIEIQSENASVCFITFSGNATSDFFKGKILPSGVDTQIQYKNKKKKLSARYVLEGVDYENNKCKIFIENNAVEENKNLTMSPLIFTDSSALKWIEHTRLQGCMYKSDEFLIIEIFTHEPISIQ